MQFGKSGTAIWRYTEDVPPTLHAALSVDSPRELIRQIETGIPYTVLDRLASESGLSAGEIAKAVGIAPRTLARRKTAGRLAPDESERVIRFSRVFEMASDLFESDHRAATCWLTTTHKAIGGDTPLNYLRTETGAREVENLIGRLEHGVFS